MKTLIVATRSETIEIPEGACYTFGRRADVTLCLEGGADDPYMHREAFALMHGEGRIELAVLPGHREVLASRLRDVVRDPERLRVADGVARHAR